MDTSLIEPEMTVYDLARLMMQGFDRVDERFEQVDARFDRLEARFDSLEYRHNKRLEKLEDDSLVMRRKLQLA